MITFEQSEEFLPEQHQVAYAQSLMPPMNKNLPFDATLPHISSHKLKQDRKLKFKMQKQSKTMEID